MNEAQTGVDAEDQVKGGDEQDDRKKEFNGWRKDAIFEVVLEEEEMKLVIGDVWRDRKRCGGDALWDAQREMLIMKLCTRKRAAG